MKIKAAQLRIAAAKVKREAERIAVATVLMQFALVTGYAVAEHKGYIDYLRPKTITIVQAKTIKPEEKKTDRIGELSEYIWNKESTKGKNNYSKCQAIGKINGIGYAIPGDGSYICFNSHEEEMQVLRGWIIAKLAQGYSEKELLCLYQSGVRTNDCKYAQGLV